jgi:hypothetical protein
MLVWRTWDRRPCTFVGFGSLIEVYATDLGRAIKKHGVSAPEVGKERLHDEDRHRTPSFIRNRSLRAAASCRHR